MQCLIKNGKGIKCKAGYIQNSNSTLRKRQEEATFTHFFFENKTCKNKYIKNDRKKQCPYVSNVSISINSKSQTNSVQPVTFTNGLDALLSPCILSLRIFSVVSV